MKKIIILLLLFVFSCNNFKEVKKNILLEKIDSLELEIKDTYKPGFGSIMSSIQDHHAKLWFAGINSNWKLAAFEIHEVNELLTDIEKFQGDRVESKYINMMNPHIEKITEAVKIQKLEMFKSNYLKLTNSCNDCHLKTNYDFIKIIVPNNNSYNNQKF